MFTPLGSISSLMPLVAGDFFLGAVLCIVSAQLGMYASFMSLKENSVLFVTVLNPTLPEGLPLLKEVYVVELILFAPIESRFYEFVTYCSEFLLLSFLLSLRKMTYTLNMWCHFWDFSYKLSRFAATCCCIVFTKGTTPTSVSSYSVGRLISKTGRNKDFLEEVPERDRCHDFWRLLLRQDALVGF